MHINKNIVLAGIVVFTPIFAGKEDHNERFTSRARGNSNLAARTIEELADVPTGSQKEPRTPEILSPTAVGMFGNECVDNDSDNEQNIMFTSFMPQTQKQSEADACPDWRKAPRSQPLTLRHQSPADKDNQWQRHYNTARQESPAKQDEQKIFTDTHHRRKEIVAIGAAITLLQKNPFDLLQEENA